VTKPGNSGSEEPTQAEAPEATDPEATETAAETPAEPTEKPAQTPAPHESPIGASGGPPNSTLPKGTDNSGSAEAAAETEAEGKAAEGQPAEAESAGQESAKPAEGEPAETRTAEPESAEAQAAEAEATEAERTEAERTEAGAARAETTAAGAEPAATTPAEDKPTAKARRARAAEDAEPLMAELEKAPPPPSVSAQAKRRFEEPAPRTLRFSLYFFVAAGGIWLISMVASLIYKQDIINNEIKRNTNPDITPDQISSAVNQILWIVTIAALAFTIFLALFGYKATEGTRRARTLVTIFAVVLILFHLLLNGTQLGILSAMFALVGLALLWSPSARKYFPPRQVP
jgi:hypothetical protein